jgi:hypothetical protein
MQRIRGLSRDETAAEKSHGNGSRPETKIGAPSTVVAE